MIPSGSVWQSSNGRTFQVINEIEIEGRVWVYYRRLDNLQDTNEFSCYRESFLERFHKLPDN